jgi:hypothetical protein
MTNMSMKEVRAIVEVGSVLGSGVDAGFSQGGRPVYFSLLNQEGSAGLGFVLASTDGTEMHALPDHPHNNNNNNNNLSSPDPLHLSPPPYAPRIIITCRPRTSNPPQAVVARIRPAVAAGQLTSPRLARRASSARRLTAAA